MYRKQVTWPSVAAVNAACMRVERVWSLLEVLKFGDG